MLVASSVRLVGSELYFVGHSFLAELILLETVFSFFERQVTFGREGPEIAVLISVTSQSLEALEERRANR